MTKEVLISEIKEIKRELLLEQTTLKGLYSELFEAEQEVSALKGFIEELELELLNIPVEVANAPRGKNVLELLSQLGPKAASPFLVEEGKAVQVCVTYYKGAPYIISLSQVDKSRKMNVKTIDVYHGQNYKYKEGKRDPNISLQDRAQVPLTAVKSTGTSFNELEPKLRSDVEFTQNGSRFTESAVKVCYNPAGQPYHVSWVQTVPNEDDELHLHYNWGYRLRRQKVITNPYN
jgi:hypothetical protein